MSRGLLAGLLALAVVGCGLDPAAKPDAKRILESLGYTHVVTGVRVMWECGPGEAGVRFTAESPIGRPVAGAVCWSLTSWAVIRLR